MQSVFAVLMDVDVSSCLVADKVVLPPNLVLCSNLCKYTYLWTYISPAWQEHVQNNSEQSDSRNLLHVHSVECATKEPKTASFTAHILRRNNQFVSVFYM